MSTPDRLDLQYGEVVDIHITGARTSSMMPDGSVLFEVGDHVVSLRPEPGVAVTRSQPADGEPEPGDVWRDQVGNAYAAIRADAPLLPDGAVMWLHRVDTGHATQWQSVHKGPTGPIRLVHRLDQAEPLS